MDVTINFAGTTIHRAVLSQRSRNSVLGLRLDFLGAAHNLGSPIEFMRYYMHGSMLLLMFFKEAVLSFESNVCQ